MSNFVRNVSYLSLSCSLGGQLFCKLVVFPSLTLHLYYRIVLGVCFHYRPDVLSCKQRAATAMAKYIHT